MKILTRALAIAVFFSVAATSNAAMMVFDHSNYELGGLLKKEIEKQSNAQLEHIDVSKDVLGSMQGNLRINSSLGSLPKKYRKELEKMLRGMIDLPFLEGMDIEIDPKSIESILKGQDAIFVPASVDRAKNAETQEERDKYIESSLRNMLATSEYSLEQYKERLEKINQLGQAADQAGDLAAKMDVANSIALETLAAINNLAVMIGQANLIESMNQYQGSTDIHSFEEFEPKTAREKFNSNTRNVTSDESLNDLCKSSGICF